LASGLEYFIFRVQVLSRKGPWIARKCPRNKSKIAGV